VVLRSVDAASSHPREQPLAEVDRAHHREFSLAALPRGGRETLDADERGLELSVSPALTLAAGERGTPHLGKDPSAAVESA
jgi:hypothetical protein